MRYQPPAKCLSRKLSRERPFLPATSRARFGRELGTFWAHRIKRCSRSGDAALKEIAGTSAQRLRADDGVKDPRRISYDLSRANTSPTPVVGESSIRSESADSVAGAWWCAAHEDSLRNLHPARRCKDRRHQGVRFCCRSCTGPEQHGAEAVLRRGGFLREYLSHEGAPRVAQERVHSTDEQGRRSRFDLSPRYEIGRA